MSDDIQFKRVPLESLLEHFPNLSLIVCGLASQAFLCYNKEVKLLCLEDALTPSRRVTYLLRRRATMDSLSSQKGLSKTSQETTFIYGLVDPDIQLIRYVGKANDPHLRLSRHLREKGHSHKNTWLKSLKDRNISPEIQIIEEVPVSDWQERETYWIRYYREKGYDLVNGTSGGDGVHGMRHTLEAKVKIGNASKGNQYRKGHKPTPETTAKRSLTLKGHPVSSEAAEKIALSKRGKPRSPETIAKIKTSLTGRKVPEDQLVKMRGRTISEEHKKKISARHTGRVVSEATRLKLRGHTISEEHRAKLIEGQKNRVVTDEERSANRERAIRLGLRPPSRKGIPMSAEAKEKKKATLAVKNHAEVKEKRILGNTIRADHSSGMTYRELVMKYGISSTQVGRVIKGEAWC